MTNLIKYATYIGAGVVADIAEPAERGSFFGLFNIGPMVRISSYVCALEH